MSTWITKPWAVAHDISGTKHSRPILRNIHPVGRLASDFATEACDFLADFVGGSILGNGNFLFSAIHIRNRFVI